MTTGVNEDVFTYKGEICMTADVISISEAVLDGIIIDGCEDMVTGTSYGRVGHSHRMCCCESGPCHTGQG